MCESKDHKDLSFAIKKVNKQKSSKQQDYFEVNLTGLSNNFLVFVVGSRLFGNSVQIS